jgi:hypothetical protein
MRITKRQLRRIIREERARLDTIKTKKRVRSIVKKYLLETRLINEAETIISRPANGRFRFDMKETDMTKVEQALRAMYKTFEWDTGRFSTPGAMETLTAFFKERDLDMSALSAFKTSLDQRKETSGKDGAGRRDPNLGHIIAPAVWDNNFQAAAENIAAMIEDAQGYRGFFNSPEWKKHKEDEAAKKKGTRKKKGTSSGSSYADAMSQVDKILDAVRAAGKISYAQSDALLDIVGDDGSFDTEEARNAIYAIDDRIQDGDDPDEATYDAENYIRDALKEQGR